MFLSGSGSLSFDASSVVPKTETVTSSSRKYASYDLSFDGHRLPYATHGLHPFPAKFPPPLARWAIEHFTAPGECSLDPFVGSGTSLVEARLRKECASVRIRSLVKIFVSGEVFMYASFAFRGRIEP